MATALTPAEVLALPASVPLVTAGRAFGMSRSATFDAYHADTFPVPVFQAGRRRLVCPRAAIVRKLGLDDVPARSA